jgi:hypothetical protein
VTLQIKILALSVIAFAVAQDGVFAQKEPTCPADMTWGGTKCEWRDYCKGGEPRRHGRCPEDAGQPDSQTEPQPPLSPRSRPNTDFTRSCPAGFEVVDNRCVPSLPAIICADGKPSVNGKCPPKLRPCEQKTIFARERDTPKSPRRVLFVGGSLISLFERYVADTQAALRPLDLEKLTITYYDNTGERHDLEEKMTLGRYFNGRTIEQVWRRSFKNVVAAQRPDAEIDARSTDADLVCGSMRK